MVIAYGLWGAKSRWGYEDKILHFWVGYLDLTHIGSLADTK